MHILLGICLKGESIGRFDDSSENRSRVAAVADQRQRKQLQQEQRESHENPPRKSEQRKPLAKSAARHKDRISHRVYAWNVLIGDQPGTGY